ncbi:MAG: hypothetical protein ACLFNM_00820 [Candidatus Woesearchaeota archaeon]
MTSSTVYDDNKKVSFFGFLFKKKSKTAELMEEEIQEAHVSDPQTYDELESIEEEVQNLDEEVETLENKKQNLMARFFQKLFSSSKKSVDDEDIEEISQEDISATVEHKESLVQEETKEVLKAMHKWLSKLPPEQIEAFRRSEDFDRYKALLQHYGVARK